VASVRTRSAIAALLVFFAFACGAAQNATPVPPQPAGPSASDLAAIEKARADSARYPYTAADIHFMSGMIGHHAQAIEMSLWAPTHGANPSIRVLAERIINAQQDEIILMQQWLRDRGQAVPDGAHPMMLSAGGVEHVMLMPGMLSQEQMRELDAARGREFDRLFLTWMIQHHRGAVDMVTELFSTYGAGQDAFVFKLASDVNIDQTTEITRMRRMLLMIQLEGGSR
jgi:uncharacterized protein (DUF305 family)